MAHLGNAFKKAVKKKGGKGGPSSLQPMITKLQALQPGDADPAELDALQAEIDRLKAPAAPPAGPPMGAGAGPMGMPPGPGPMPV